MLWHYSCTEELCPHFVRKNGSGVPKTIGITALFRFVSVDYSHSLRLNALCVIYVYLIPSGDSDSLRHSYSTACTASGYHFVISAITGETVLL